MEKFNSLTQLTLDNYIMLIWLIHFNFPQFLHPSLPIFQGPEFFSILFYFLYSFKLLQMAANQDRQDLYINK